MMFGLAESASKRRRLLNSSKLLPDVLQGIPFQDGAKSTKPPPRIDRVHND